jgi:lipoate---protein ligase
MLLIQRHNTDPYFNIAAEEYVLKSFQDDIIMLWQNKPAIIVGKHQNALAEINLNWAKENNIPVIRRISGGGTVYHDQGNLNFTFIKNIAEENLVDFRRFTLPIVEILGTLGLDARFEGRNDIRINGLKISGNAEHVFKKRVLHHGTLLFSSSLNSLSQALKVSSASYTDKSVKSVRSRVTNIAGHLDRKMDVPEFKSLIQQQLTKKYPDVKTVSLTDKDHDLINRLVQEKYKTWEWNFGYSPKYLFKNTIESVAGQIEMELVVQNGIIHQAGLKSNTIKRGDLAELERLLTNIPHWPEKIREAFQTISGNYCLKTLNPDNIIAGLF